MKRSCTGFRLQQLLVKAHRTAFVKDQSSHPSVLFVCTGNIFRSMTAEFALKQTLGSRSNVHVQSAGLIDAPHEIVPFVSDYLLRRGIDTTTHQPRKLSAEIMASATLTVAMDLVHQREVQSQYDVKPKLFNELAYGKALPMPDVDEVIPDWRNNEAEARRYGESVMDGIFDGMPGVVERIPALLKLT